MIINYLYRKRAQNISSFISSYLRKNQAILNVGAGDCFLDENLTEAGFLITPIDIKNHSRTIITPLIFNGLKLPFKDKQFDVVMANYILFLNPEKYKILISEMSRVSKKYLLIIEDTPLSQVEFLLKKIWGLILYRKHKLMFKPRLEWENIFNSLGLKILKMKKININLISFFGFNQTLFYLKKWQ